MVAAPPPHVKELLWLTSIVVGFSVSPAAQLR